MRHLGLIVVILITIASPAFPEPRRSLVVFAGSASQPPLEEAAQAFEKKNGTQITLHLGGSGAMLSQMILTGMGDLYIPGSPDYMQKAKAIDLVEGEETILAYLIPAILVPKDNPLQISGLNDLARSDIRVGMADPNSVCVGLYAVELLESNGMTEKIRPRLHGQVESCAKTAAMLPLGTVDAVLGWREFAAWNPGTTDVVLLKPQEIPRLAYIPAARLRDAKNPEDAKNFIAYLKSDEGQAIFHKWGYFTKEEDARNLFPEARIGGTYDLPEGW